MNSKLTPRVINAAYSASRSLDMSKELFLSSLLDSYVEENRDFTASGVSHLSTGKRLVPKPVVRHYASKTSLCPENLYKDVWNYYEEIPRKRIISLWHSLCDLMKIIPAADQERIYCGVNDYPTIRERTCGLLTRMLCYAWRSDLCGMRFAAT